MNYETGTELGGFAGEMIRALDSGVAISEAAARLAGEHAGLFDDLLGRMLLRALSVS
jgi:hypothetical protein